MGCSPISGWSPWGDGGTISTRAYFCSSGMCAATVGGRLARHPLGLRCGCLPRPRFSHLQRLPSMHLPCRWNLQVAFIFSSVESCLRICTLHHGGICHLRMLGRRWPQAGTSWTRWGCWHSARALHCSPYSLTAIFVHAVLAPLVPDWTSGSRMWA